ncbi:hypothetical protein CDAR_525081 [Caerostris darwini]|uniref:Uncharacterized protein n=1 Tax=Caerostris darwini TaxID=1538125 RepID=A0AAV4R0V9_9ARAC|nr:hypothetical protein CDAR_525081 [Caerostris darwini]
MCEHDTQPDRRLDIYCLLSYIGYPSSSPSQSIHAAKFHGSGPHSSLGPSSSGGSALRILVFYQGTSTFRGKFHPTVSSSFKQDSLECLEGMSPAKPRRHIFARIMANVDEQAWSDLAA